MKNIIEGVNKDIRMLYAITYIWLIFNWQKPASFLKKCWMLLLCIVMQLNRVYKAYEWLKRKLKCLVN